MTAAFFHSNNSLYANSKDLSILFYKNEKVKYIKNPLTEREKIFDKDGNVILESYTDVEDIGIITDAYTNEQKLIYKCAKVADSKYNGVYYEYEDDYPRQGYRDAKVTTFYDLKGKEIGIKDDDNMSFYLFNDNLILNTYCDEESIDYQEKYYFKNEVIIYDLNNIKKGSRKLYDGYYAELLIKNFNDYLFINLLEKSNSTIVSKGLYILDKNGNEVKKFDPVKMIGNSYKEYNWFIERQIEIDGKIYYELKHTARGVAVDYSLFNSTELNTEYLFNLLDENLKFVFKNDILRAGVNGENIERQENRKNREEIYRSYLKDTTKLNIDGSNRKNIFDKVINFRKVGKKYYYIVKDEEGIKIIDDEFKDITDTVKLSNLYIDANNKDVSKIEEFIFYSKDGNTTDYYSIYGNKFNKIYSTPKRDGEYADVLARINDGYFTVISFKQKDKDEYGYVYYEKMIMEEIVFYNINPNVEPYIFKSIYQRVKRYEEEYAEQFNLGYYIMEFNGARYLRLQDQSGVEYTLYTEDGTVKFENLSVCHYFDDKKDMLLVSKRYGDIILYDSNFKEIKLIKKKWMLYNGFIMYTLGNKNLVCLYNWAKDDNGKTVYNDGAMLIDKEGNVLYDNLKDKVYIINKTNKNNKATEYDNLILMTAVKNYKKKNGETSIETFILDKDMNKVFSINKPVEKEEQYFDVDDNVVLTLHIYKDEYVLFDKAIKVIERGKYTEGIEKDIREKYRDEYLKYRSYDDGYVYGKPIKEDFANMVGVDGLNYVNRKLPDSFEKINIKDDIILYKESIEKDYDNMTIYDYENKFNYRYTLYDVKNGKNIIENCLSLSNFSDNYYEYANGFRYGFMDYDGNELISFSFFDDMDYEDKKQIELGWRYG